MITDICSMYILITAATSREIQQTAEFINTQNNEEKNHEIKVLITGIGSVATTYFLTDFINKKKPDIILQAGIAGCFTKKKPGGVVVVKEDFFGDVGVIENNEFKNIFELNLMNENDAPFINGILLNPNKKLLSLSQLEEVRSVTINEITTNKERIDFYQQKFSPVVESMEGAAFHYVCLQKNIPFLQIRSISNDIAERDKTKWDFKNSINSLNENLIFIIKEICKKNETYFGV
jgi:futalosine hydrolase